jgi:streptogrisin C
MFRKDLRFTSRSSSRAFAWVTAVAAAAMLLATVTPAPTLASERDEPSNLRAIDSRFSLEEFQDLSTYAKQENIALDKVLDRFAGLSQFYELLAEVRGKVGDSVVAAEWGFGSGTVYVHPSAVSPLRETYRNDKTEFVESNSPSEMDQQELTAEVHAAFAGKGFSSVEARYDFRSNAVDISVPLDTLHTRPFAEAVSQASTVAAEHSAKITVAPLTTQAEPDARGGMAYGSGCTGGFVVQSLGVHGISTAHHCTTKPSTYDGSNLGTTTAYGSRDVRWSRFSSGTAEPVFRYSSGNYRTVANASDPVVGATVCKYGITTGNTCDVVVSSGHCVTYSGFPQFCGQFRTDNRDAAGGDSGGPWYYGSRAHGIHSGGSDIGNYDQFSGIGSLALLGVTVITG